MVLELLATLDLLLDGASFGGTVGLPVEHEAVGVVAKAIQGCRGEQAVCGEGLVPLGEVEIGGDDRGDLLVALGDQIVQVLIGGRPKRFEAEVIDDEQRHAGKRGEFAVVGTDGARRVEACGEGQHRW